MKIIKKKHYTFPLSAMNDTVSLARAIKCTFTVLIKNPRNSTDRDFITIIQMTNSSGERI